MKSVWLIWDGDYDSYDVKAIYSTREAAEAAANGREIEERPVYNEPLPRWQYWQAIAEVYPDKTVQESFKEYWADDEVTLLQVDAHLNTLAEPWDGHTQGHCGEHVSVVGTDAIAVQAAFRRHVLAAIERQNGICPSEIHRNFSGDVDGRTIYAAGWGHYRRAGTGKTEEFACGNYFEHDWGEWSEEWGVGHNTTNRQRVCKRCSTLSLRVEVVDAQ